ncbi:MAG: hypothetical protein R3A48_00790 [Polyangiales bacterium]
MNAPAGARRAVQRWPEAAPPPPSCDNPAMPPARPRPTPPYQKLRGHVAALALDGDDTAWLWGDGQRSLERFDLRARRVADSRATAAPMQKLVCASPGVVVGTTRGADDVEAVAAVFDASSGAVRATLRPPAPQGFVRAVAASSTHVAVSSDPGRSPTGTIELYTLDGAHRRSVDLGRGSFANTPDGVIFSGDGLALVYVVDGALVRHELATGREERAPCEVPRQWGWSPRTTRQGEHLLLQFHAPGHSLPSFVVRERDGAVIGRIEPAQLTTFGLPGELVWQEQRELRRLSLTGETLATMTRGTQTRLEAGATTTSGLWIAGGPASIELVDLHRLGAPG